MEQPMQEVQKTKQSSVDLSKVVAQSTGLLAIKLSSTHMQKVISYCLYLIVIVTAKVC